MKTITQYLAIAIAALFICGSVMSQDVENPIVPEEPAPGEPLEPEPSEDEEPAPAEPEEPEPTDGEEPEPEDPDNPDDQEPVLPVPVFNATQTQKAEKFSEASGVPVEDILRLRAGQGIQQPDTEDSEPQSPPPKGRGWGVIAKWLGLHPGTAGNGNGDKFMPEPNDIEVADDELPDLPEVTPEAKRAVVRTKERTRKRAKETADRELELAHKSQPKVQQESRGRSKSRDAAEKTQSPRKTKRERPGKPERSGKPDNPGKK